MDPLPGIGGHEYAATRHRFEFRQPGQTGPTATADVAEFREGTRYSGQWMPHAVANDHEASRVSPRVEDFADTGFSEDDTRSLLIASGHEGGYGRNVARRAWWCGLGLLRGRVRGSPSSRDLSSDPMTRPQRQEGKAKNKSAHGNSDAFHHNLLLGAVWNPLSAMLKAHSAAR